MKTEEIVIQQDVSFTPATMLRAGDLTLMYESGRIRYIKTTTEEVLRMIYPALRDESWNTIPPGIINKTIENNPDSFVVRYEAEYDSGPVRYKAVFAIRGHSDGTITYRMQGEALSGFQSRRIGLCVHHPIGGCAGRPVDIVNSEGKILQGQFPVLISPQPPFTDVSAMRWTSPGHQRVEVKFEGDRFETEDQRNWTDDSFKTYSGPLAAVPMIHVSPGDRMEQTVTLSFHTDAGPVAPQNWQEAIETKIPFPSIGYQRGPHQGVLTAEVIKLLKSVPFDHYRVDIHLQDGSWRELLQTAIKEAIALETKVELVVFFHSTSDAEVAELIREVDGGAKTIGSILVLSDEAESTPPAFFSMAQAQLHKAFPSIQLGYGTDGNFAELNRNLPGDLPYDFVSFPVHPQVHFTDSRSILENLGSQHTTIETLRRAIGNRDIHVSPVTIQPRPAYGSRLNGSLNNDTRQNTGMTAWWMINAIKNFGDARHLTFFELVGERGILPASAAEDHTPLPVLQVLSKLKAFSPVFIIETKDPSICFEDGNGDRLCFTAGFTKEALV